MKTIARIMFNGNHYPGGPTPALRAAGYDVGDASIAHIRSLGSIAVTIEVEDIDPRRAVLLSVLKAHDVSWLEIIFDRYTHEELLRATLILMVPNSEREVSGGLRYGTTFELSGACQHCGTGARQTSALIVAGEEVAFLRDATAAQTSFFDVLIRNDVAYDLVGAAVTGMELHHVFESCGGTQRRLPFRQLCAEKALPRMSAHTEGVTMENACPACRRSGHFQMNSVPTRPHYSPADLRGAQDVNATWECFGYSILKPDLRESLIARPLLVISPKVLKIFMDHGITAFDYYPVRIDDSA